MTVTVEVHEDEPIELALRRFRRKVEQHLARQWYKRRFGYYEKPSELKRSKKKMARRQTQYTRFVRLNGSDQARLRLTIGLHGQFKRTGPSAPGR